MESVAMIPVVLKNGAPEFPKRNASDARRAVVTESWGRKCQNINALIEDEPDPVRVIAPGRTFDSDRIDQDHIGEEPQT